MRRTGANASLNLLWALEGALTGQPWQDVAKNERLCLLLELEDIESEEGARRCRRAASKRANLSAELDHNIT